MAVLHPHRIGSDLAVEEVLPRLERAEESFGRRTRARDTIGEIDEIIAFDNELRGDLQTLATCRQSEGVMSTYRKTLMALAYTIGTLRIIAHTHDLVAPGDWRIRGEAVVTI